jgi:hypothetical protein
VSAARVEQYGRAGQAERAGRVEGGTEYQFSRDEDEPGAAHFGCRTAKRPQ